MTPVDQDLFEPTKKEKEDAQTIRAQQLSNRSQMARRVEAAKKWQAEHQKNALLFPSSYDYF